MYWRLGLVLLGVLCGLISVAGCRSAKSSYYLLRPGNPTAGADLALTVGLGPFEFPEYLDRRELVETVGRTRVRVRERHLWAEPLSASIATVTLENLGGLLGTERIVLHPWNSDLEPDVTIEARILRFDVIRGEQVLLRAAWSLRRSGRTDVSMHRGEYRESIEGSSAEASVEAMSRALFKFAQQLASDIRRVPAPAPKEPKHPGSTLDES